MPDDLVADWQELTPAEQDLLHAVLSGRRAELAGQTIRASVVRDLAIGANPDQRVPPVGIGIHNATIEGSSTSRAARSTSRSSSCAAASYPPPRRTPRCTCATPASSASRSMSVR